TELDKGPPFRYQSASNLAHLKDVSRRHRLTERERFPRAGVRHLRSRAASGNRPAGMMTGLRGNPLHWDGRGRVTPAPTEFRPRKRVLELSCGVRSPQQVPWWNAGRRARSAERAPRPYGA